MINERLVKSTMERQRKHLARSLTWLKRSLDNGWNSEAVDALMDAAEYLGKVEAFETVLELQKPIGSKDEFKRNDALWELMDKLRSRQKNTIGAAIERGEYRGPGKVKDNPGHGKKRKPKSSSSRPGYRVCARTTSGGWANKGTDLSGPEADALMRKLKREGFEVAKFKGRKRVK